MEQQSHSFGTSENLPDFSTNSFPNDAFIEHLAECVEVPFQNHAHIQPYQFCSDSFDGYDENWEPYSDGVDVNRNIVNEDFLEDDRYVLPYEQYVSSESNDYEYIPLENFQYDYLNNMYQYEWHQEDFYNGANLETIDSAQYSIDMTNYYTYLRRGTTYFSTHRSTSNGLDTGHTTYAQPKPGLTGTEHPDVEHVEAQLNTKCIENSTFVESKSKSFKEATEPETPRTDVTNAESRLETAKAEIPNIDYTNEIKTPLGATKAETILKTDVSELVDTLSECLILDPSNAEFQPDTSNSNSQCIAKETNYAGSLNSTNLNDGQNSGDPNNCEHVDGKDGKNVSDHVENGGNGGQTDRNRNVSSNANRRNKRDNSRKVSGNNRRGESSAISLKNFDSRRNDQSSSDYNSLNDRNGSNGVENADSRQGSRRNNGNSYAARSREDSQSKVCNRTCHVHCDEFYSNSHEDCETSGVSSEVRKSNFSYSAAVKRSLKSVH